MGSKFLDSPPVISVLVDRLKLQSPQIVSHDVGHMEDRIVVLAKDGLMANMSRRKLLG